MTIQEMAQVMLDLAADEQARLQAAELAHEDDVTAFAFGIVRPQVSTASSSVGALAPIGSQYLGKPLMVCKGCHGG